jgi:hypothetical protein
MMENITHFFEMTAWQKMYFIGMWIGMSWFILEIQKIVKEVVKTIPKIKRTFKDETKRQRVEISKLFKH